MSFSFDNIQKFKSVFFIGIGGISMSSLAFIAKNSGLEVGGSDITSSEMTKKLENSGIKVLYGHSYDNPKGYDAVVYTAAISENNPELLYAKQNGIPLIYRANYLGELMKDYSDRIGVAGMHGKSTVTGMISHIFIEQGKDPTVLNGAVTKELEGAYRLGNKNSFIFEACEYKDSFLSFYPDTAVLLNLEMDHVDYFHSLEQIKDSFRKYLSISKKAVVNADCHELSEVTKDYRGELFTYGVQNKAADFTSSDIRIAEGGFYSFDINYKGTKLCRVCLGIPGKHNISNALCAVAVAYIHGISPEKAAESMANFVGVKRRNEYKGIYHGAYVYDDYAHHPTEIKASLEGLRKLCKGRLICVYQPHTYSRTAGLFDEFTKAFDEADEVIFAEIYAAREQNTIGISSEDLAKKVKNSVYLSDFGQITEYLTEKTKKDDLIVTMGAGDIFKLHPMLGL